MSRPPDSSPMRTTGSGTGRWRRSPRSAPGRPTSRSRWAPRSWTPRPSWRSPATCRPRQFNRGPFQETGRHYQADAPGVLRPYVKRSFQATRADQLPLMLRQAFAVMLAGRPGPVHLDVPLDVFVEASVEPVPDPGLWRRGISPRSGRRRCRRGRDFDLLAAARTAGDRGRLRRAERRGRARSSPRSPPPPASRWSPPRSARAPPTSRSPLYLGATGRNGTYQANRAPAAPM